ncbi:hypothetical protein IAR55_003247 [Kwoniella newhampshirensis]|uniref:Uncharacterized protein n=1 Tax=Kwoniella newhampshirensis TaxID=1651941 RepID=A0AAW0Z1B3_9TREE
MRTTEFFSVLSVLSAFTSYVTATPTHHIRDTFKTSHSLDGSVVRLDLEHSAQIVLLLSPDTTISNESWTKDLVSKFPQVNPEDGISILLNATGNPADDVRETFDWIVHEKALKAGGSADLDVFSLHCGAQVNARLDNGPVIFDFKMTTEPPFLIKDNADNSLNLTCHPAQCMVRDCGPYVGPVINSANAKAVTSDELFKDV